MGQLPLITDVTSLGTGKIIPDDERTGEKAFPTFDEAYKFALGIGYEVISQEMGEYSDTNYLILGLKDPTENRSNYLGTISFFPSNNLHWNVKLQLYERPVLEEITG